MASFVREIAAGNGTPSIAQAVGGAGVPINDLLLVYVERDNAAVVTDSKGNTWTKLLTNGVTPHLELWWCSVTIALTAADTINIANVGTQGYEIHQFTGSSGAWTVAQSYIDNTSGSTLALGPATGITPGNVVVFAFNGSLGTFTQTSALTMVDQDFVVTSGANFNSAYVIAAGTTATFSGTTTGGVVTYNRVFAEFAPASGASGSGTVTETVTPSGQGVIVGAPATVVETVTPSGAQQIMIPPVNLVLPTIGGSPVIGATLTADPGTWI